MADQCIICLEALDIISPEENVPHPHLPDTASSAAVDQSSENTQQPIAVIKPCNHTLHDECLQLWTQKANSCPICRQNFNEVEVHDKVGGNLLSKYDVADKKQVEDLDPSEYQEDDPDFLESAPCPICNHNDQEDILLICDGCEANYHTHCVGLDRIPLDDWYCMECVAAGAFNPENTVAQEQQRRRARLFTQRTQGQLRRARRAGADRWQGAWNQISSRVWEHLNLDLDFNEDDDNSLVDFRRHQANLERQGRQRQWQQRLRIASRQGARDVFRDSTQILHRTREHPVAPPQESAEEAASWRAMERAQELQRSSSARGRKRKSRSATTSPAEPPAPAEPERKLKRPRTRRVLDSGATSDNAAESSSHRRGLPPRRPEHQASSPSFLSSLLKEVESSPAPENDNRAFFDASTAVPFSDQSSRAASPASSNYSTPRGMSITPPPPNSKRPSSPLPLTSHVMPAFPASNYSPPRTSPENEQREPSSPSRPELRMPRPRKRNHSVVEHSDEASPTRASMSLQAKEDINKIVKGALKTYWRPGGITKDQYMEVNRLVSRTLYDKITDPLDETTKSMWEKIAQTEVAKAIKGLAA